MSTGWQAGASSIVIPSSRFTAVDEPLAYSAGGNVIYWTHCCDRSAGAFDLNGNGAWVYFEYNLEQSGARLRCEVHRHSRGARSRPCTEVGTASMARMAIRIRLSRISGKVYVHRSNAIIAWAAQGGAQALPMSCDAVSERAIALRRCDGPQAEVGR